MRKTVLLFVLVLVAISCGSRHAAARHEEELRPLMSSFEGRNSGKVDRILQEAEDYLGTPYRLGGNTRSGLDCSGLVTLVFKEHRIQLPRRSQEQAQQGKRIEVNEVRPGDLLFFATNGPGLASHVGLVKEIRGRGEIFFIHSSTTKGVIISSLNERYWNKAFLYARRIL